MLTIRKLEALEVKIPFRFTFRHSLAARSEGHSILVRATSREGLVGYGECVPRSYVTGETPESVLRALQDTLARPFVGASFATFDEVVQSLMAGSRDLPRDRHAAFCALELALLDLAGKIFGRSAGDVLGPLVAKEATYSGIVSADGVEASLASVDIIRSLGFAQVKLKVGGSAEDDRRLLAAARSRLGQDASLRIDANAAWSAEEALARIHSFEPFALQAVEQPVAGDDHAGLAWLTARSPVPVLVDESLASLEDARRLIALRACHGFNIRISKCGGLINSARIRDLAQSEGLLFQLGAQVGETALLSAAGRQFATRSPAMRFAEGSYGSLLLEEDLGTEDLTVGFAGKAPALERPGLGVELDAARVERYTVAHHVLGGS